MTAGHFCRHQLRPMKNIKESEFTGLYVTYSEQIGVLPDLEIREIDLLNDMCIVYSPGHKLRPVNFKNKYTNHVRQKIYTVGAPLGTFPIETSGYTSLSNLTVLDLSNITLLSMPIFRGNSGGPVFDEDASVIGMIIAGSSSYSNISFAINLETIKRFLDYLKIDYNTD